MFTPYSQLSQILVLDPHSRHFFEPTLWEGVADAIFSFEDQEFAGRVFRGRVMPTLQGRLYLVMQDVNSIGGDCLLVNIAVPKGMPSPSEWTREQSAEFVGSYFEKNLFIRFADRNADVVPILRNVMCFEDLKRLHFDARTGLGLEFFYFDCNVLNLQGAQSELEFPRICLDLDNDWLSSEEAFDEESGAHHLKSRMFATMDGAAFHARVEAITSDTESKPAQILRLVAMDDEALSFELFGCPLETLLQALEMLRLALLIAMGVEEAFKIVEHMSWHPLAARDVKEILCFDDAGNWIDPEVPLSLRLHQDAIVAKLGYAFCGKHLGEIALAFAERWAHGFEVSVSRPNQHEVVEANLRLNALMKPGEFVSQTGAA